MQDISHTLKILTVWLLLGTLVFLGFQAWQAHQGRTQFSAVGGAIEIRRSSDGHYHWPGRVNGVEVDFLVDTGATSTALPRELAAHAGLEGEALVTSSTAGGVVHGAMAHADVELDGGIQVRRLRVTVLPGLAAPLLGMDVLSRLRWSQGRGVLRIESQHGSS